MPARALAAEPDPDVRAVVAALVAADGFEVVTAGDWAAAAALLLDTAAPLSVAVIDRDTPGFYRPGDLTLLRAAGCGVPVVLIGYPTGRRSPGRPGGDALTTFLPKPFARDSLARAVGDLLSDACRPDFVIPANGL